jgi:hypothetical protein
MPFLEIAAGVVVTVLVVLALSQWSFERDIQKGSSKRAREREAEEAAEAQRARDDAELWVRGDAEAQAINASLWGHTAARVEAHAKSRACWIYRSSVPDERDNHPEMSWAADKAIKFWDEADKHELAHTKAVAQLTEYANGLAEAEIWRSQVKGDDVREASWTKAKMKYEAEEAAGARARAEAEEQAKAAAIVVATEDARTILAEILAKPSET